MVRSNGIGTLSEKSLHAKLKQWYAREGDLIEELVEGYHIDIKRGSLLIEIQTRNFSAIKTKLEKLLANYDVKLIYPIAENKWITRIDTQGNEISRRKSPKNGRPEELFGELIRMPHLAGHPRLSIEVLLVNMEEIWRDDGLGSWRRGKWSIHDRELIAVNQQIKFSTPTDFMQFIPKQLGKPFTIKQLAKTSSLTPTQSRKMAYCLRKMSLLEVVGKEGNAHVLDYA